MCAQRNCGFVQKSKNQNGYKEFLFGLVFGFISYNQHNKLIAPHLKERRKLFKIDAFLVHFGIDFRTSIVV